MNSSAAMRCLSDEPFDMTFLDALSIGLAITDPTATILSSNRAFQRLLGLPIGGTLRLQRWPVASDSCGDRGVACRMENVQGTQLAVHVFTLDAARHQPGYLVAVRNITEIGDASERLAMLFDLAPREAEVAQLLVQGHDLKTLARQLQIATSTARAHLRSIFRKTGTNRQAALVMCLASASAV